MLHHKRDPLLTPTCGVSSSILRTDFTTSKGLGEEAVGTEPRASCPCSVVPVLLCIGLAHEAFLQGGFPLLHKTIAV